MATTNNIYISRYTGAKWAEHLGFFSIDADGKVGIGTASPVDKLHIVTANGFGITMTYGTDGSYKNSIVNSYGGAYSFMNFLTSIDGSGGQRSIMKLMSHGKAAFGTEVPTAYISLGVTGSMPTAETSATNFLRLGSSITLNGLRLIGFGYDPLVAGGTPATYSSAYMGSVEMSAAGYGACGLVFGTRSATTDTSASERMRIDLNGLVGINNTGPTSQLDVVNSTASNIALSVKGAASQSANLQEWQDSSGVILARVSSSGKLTTGEVLVAGGTISATTSTLGLFGVTAVAQPTTAITAASFITNTSLTADDSATWNGYTIGQIVAALRAIGILA